MSLENYESKLTTGYYRVRKTWEDEESQIGQYRLLNSAVKKADENPGYSVFTPAGIAIYPDEAETTPDAPVATVSASGDEGQTNTQSEGENGLEADLRISDNYEIEDGTETVTEPTVTDVMPTTTDEEIAAEWGESVNDEEKGESVNDEDTLTDDDLAAQTEALGEDVSIDYLSHTSVKNTGQFDQCYITNHHPAIVSREQFERVRTMYENGELNSRNRRKAKDSTKGAKKNA